MVYADSAMARCDPSSEKENLVPRAHRSEPGSGGLGSVRTRGLMNNEQRLHTVLKESSLQNQTPAVVISSKTTLASTEKEWLKNSSSDYSSGKQSAASLERLEERIGQLKKPLITHKTTFDFHSVSELHSRGLSPNVSEAAVHVYRDDKVSNSRGIQKETLKAESQRRTRQVNSRNNISLPIHEQSQVELQDVDDCERPHSHSTPTKSSAAKDNESSMQSHGSLFSRGTPYKKKLSAADSMESSRRSVQNKVDSGGHFTGEKQSVNSSLVEAKSFVVHDLQGKYSLAGETSRITSPQEEEAKSSCENSVERHPLPSIPSKAALDKLIKRAKISNFGPALRVRIDDPRYPRASPKAGHSPDSETSADDGQKSPEELHASKTADNHANVRTIMPVPKKLEAGILRVSQNASLQTDGDFLCEHRKRKAETDPSTTVTSHLLTGVLGNDRELSFASIAMETHEGFNKGGNLAQREREGRTERETRPPELTALEQSDERWIEDVVGHSLPGSCTKGTPGHEREPWAWKTARDSRSLALPSPNEHLHEYAKSGKVIGGIPPRYVPPVSESRERKAEENDSPASDGLKHHSDVLKQMNEVEKNEPNNCAIPHSNLHVKGLACSDDNAVNHLSNTFSTISIEEKIASGSNGAEKTSRTQTHVSGHHVNHFVPAESGSHTGVTGVTGLTGLTSPSAVIPHKTAVTSSQGVELQHRPHSQQSPKEGNHGPDGISALPKSTGRATATAAEVPVHDVHEVYSAKASDTSKDRGEKNQEINQYNNPQPPRKIRTETENEKFVYVNGIRYQKLGRIGKGGSSEVFKVIATDCSIYALKRINLKGRDWSTAQEFYQEIKYLKTLRGKRHIIQLIDSEVTNKKVLEKRSASGDITEEASIYMVLEFGEIDLAGMLSAKRKDMLSNNETKPDENWLRFYWQQILQAVRTIHDERIVHSDLKPANFMLVRGELKLIDFGIAKAIQNDTTNIVKENQTGTLNYMSPEAFLQNQTDEDGLEIKIGRASDIWSLGCIFYQMLYGQTPFAELSFYSKMQAITNPHHKIHYPRVSNNPWLLDIIKKCLTWDRRKRLRIPELLEHPFLRPQVAPYCSRCEHLLSPDPHQVPNYSKCEYPRHSKPLDAP